MSSRALILCVISQRCCHLLARAYTCIFYGPLTQCTLQALHAWCFGCQIGRAILLLFFSFISRQPGYISHFKRAGSSPNQLKENNQRVGLPIWTATSYSNNTKELIQYPFTKPLPDNPRLAFGQHITEVLISRNPTDPSHRVLASAPFPHIMKCDGIRFLL